MKVRKRRVFILVIIIAAIAFGIFKITWLLINNKTSKPQVGIKAAGNSSKLNNEQLTQKINQLLSKSFSTDELVSLSLSIEIPEYGYTFTHNENAEYINASTIKVPLNLYIYNLAKKDSSLLNQKLTYTNDFYEEGSGIMQGAESGSTYDIQTLLTNSIKYSDNIATNMLFNEFVSDLSSCTELVPYFGDADYLNWTSTSKNKMQTLNYLYIHQSEFETLINDMKETIYRDRLPKYLPEQVNVALKTGDINSTIHDYGIVFDDTNIDYLITISMNGVENKDERMANLSKDIYTLIQDETASLK